MTSYRSCKTVHKPLHLTQDEALALLDICLLTKVEDDPVREKAVEALSAVCREFLREDALHECGRTADPASNTGRGGSSRLIAASLVR